MKLKNIEVGDWIVAKNVHGGDDSYKILEIGESYEVIDFSEDSDLNVIIAVPNDKDFADGLYICPENFKKSKPSKIKQLKKRVKALENCCESLERLTTELNHSLPNPIERQVELTGSDLAEAMLARGDKWVLCLVANNPANINYGDEPNVVISHDDLDGFYIRDSYFNYAIPVNHKGKPLTAKEVGL